MSIAIKRVRCLIVACIPPEQRMLYLFVSKTWYDAIFALPDTWPIRAACRTPDILHGLLHTPIALSGLVKAFNRNRPFKQPLTKSYINGLFGTVPVPAPN